MPMSAPGISLEFIWNQSLIGTGFTGYGRGLVPLPADKKVHSMSIHNVCRCNVFMSEGVSVTLARNWIVFYQIYQGTTGTSDLGRLKLRCCQGLHHGSCVQTADEWRDTTTPHLTPDLTTTMAFEDNYQTCEPFVNCTADLIIDDERNISHCQPPAVQNISELMLSSIGKRRTVAVIVTSTLYFSL